MKKISVIICTYNRAQSLNETIKCLSYQSLKFDNWELIIVDNNSSDDTKKIIDDYTSIFPNINYKYQPKQGLSYARNLGIISATGSIIVFTDDDVLPEINWLEKIQNNMEVYNCDACGGYIYPKWEIAPPSWLTEKFYGFLALKIEDNGPRKLSQFDEMPFGANMIFKKTVFSKYGYFDTSKGRKGNVLAGGEDIEMFDRIISKGCVVYYFPNIKVAHKIEAFRVKKSYFRRWRFEGSINIAKTSNFEHAKSIFGIPIYLLNQTLQSIIKSLFFAIKMPSDVAFRQEIITWHFFGLVVGLFKLRNNR